MLTELQKEESRLYRCDRWHHAGRADFAHLVGQQKALWKLGYNAVLHVLTEDEHSDKIIVIDEYVDYLVAVKRMPDILFYLEISDRK